MKRLVFLSLSLLLLLIMPLANLSPSIVYAAMAGGQAPAPLGSAGAFAVLAGSTVTNTGPTKVTGYLGVAPGSAVIGFPPGKVIGTPHAGDPDRRPGQTRLDHRL